MRSEVPALALGLLGFVGVACATTHRVPSEYATINQALDVSAFGDTVLVAPGTYTDWENRPGPGSGYSAAAFLVDGVVLRSEAGPDVTILDVQGQGMGSASTIQARDLPSDATAIEGFTIRGVHYPDSGILAVYCGKVTVRDCRLLDVGIQDPGTGSHALRSRYTDIEVVDCSFENCWASGGGAIGQLSGGVMMSGCEIISCGWTAVYLTGESNPFHAAEISDCVFRGNITGGGGAALLISDLRNGVSITDCWFEDNVSTGPTGSGGAVRIQQSSRPATVTGCVFINNHLQGFGHGGTLTVSLSSGFVTVSSNTFYGSTQDNAFGGSTVDLLGQSDVSFSNNVLSASTSGLAVVYAPEADVTSSCNVFWDNEAAPAHGFELDPTDRIVDPNFCDPESGDLTVSALSPCLPANSLGCGLIGALGQGCGMVSIAPRSWGTIKSMYR